MLEMLVLHNSLIQLAYASGGIFQTLNTELRSFGTYYCVTRDIILVPREIATSLLAQAKIGERTAANPSISCAPVGVTAKHCRT